MLTGKLVRVRYARQRVIPIWLDPSEPKWVAAVEELLAIYRNATGRARSEIDEDVDEEFGDLPDQLVYRGLAKLLEDRCDFEVESALAPEQIREAVFLAAAKQRQDRGQRAPHDEQNVTITVASTFDRMAVLTQAAAQLGLTNEQIDHGLFADLKSAQRLIHFEDTVPQRLLERYNVALAQAVLLRASGVEIRIRGEPPAKYRQLLRLVKFHRLVCDIESGVKDEHLLKLDGPLSLFSATQKYGLQLALFLPAVLRCRDFELTADLRWGPKRTPKVFTLTPAEGLVSHDADRGIYVPPELAMFAELFRKKIADWDISEETALLPLGNGFWVPDFRLMQRATGKVVYLDILGFWRRSHVEKHLDNLRQHAKHPFVLAVSEQLHVHDEELESLPGAIHRFRQMPLPDEVARLAAQA